MCQEKVTRIAVIGAGAAGLVQLQSLLEAWGRKEVESRLEVVAFEKKEDLGGVWLDDNETKHAIYTSLPNEQGKADDMYSYPPESEDPSPMYEGMRTNLPTALMAFRGFPFPEETDMFPDPHTIAKYLQDFATAKDLRPHIRFHTRVTRLYLSPDVGSRRWTVESARVTRDGAVERAEEFDFVSVCNGHYSDGWIPNTPGLSSFSGRVIHSRFYRRPSDFVGQTVLIVGSFASGGDISRLLASHNINKFTPSGEPLNGHSKDHFIKLYVSSAGVTSFSPSTDGPWAPFIHNQLMIEQIFPPDEDHPKGVITFTDGEQVDDVDTIIYATGYNFAYPFFKATDAPWKGEGGGMVDGIIRTGERKGGEEWEEGGGKGLGMKRLDELLMFLEGDRSIAFPALPYQVVPFLLAQVQARLASLLWAGLLPNFPQYPTLPPNPTNPYFNLDSEINPSLSNEDVSKSQTFTTDSVEAPKEGHERPATRKSLNHRQKLMFGSPYEWAYSEYLMELMLDADKGREDEVEDHWKVTEDWRRKLRAETGLRKKTIGY